MSGFGMNTGAVSQSGNKFQRYSEDYEAQMNNLKKAISELGNSWHGEEYNQFLEDYEECERGLAQMKTAFNDLGEVLVSAANSTSNAQQDISSQISRQD